MREGRIGSWGQQMETSIYRMDKQQGPTNYIQYPVINHNGKEYKKERMYIYN